ncbi:UNVERIFIED_ORG: hypothetical protein B2H98_06055 [Clostridium botulinum]
MKKIVFNDGELRDSGINFNVFCLMQLSAKEYDKKLEISTRDIKVMDYGEKLGRKDFYNIFDECGNVKERSTTLRREHICNNGVAATYTYLAFSFEKRNIIEIEEEKLLRIIRKNNSRLTKLYMYLLMETKEDFIVISQKQLLISIGLSPRSEGSLKKMTNMLIKENFLKVNKYKDSRGINRIEYKVQ